MASTHPTSARRRVPWQLIAGIVVAITGVAGWYLRDSWLPTVTKLLSIEPVASQEHAEAESGHDDAHNHGGADNSIKLSVQGLQNIGFEPVTIRLQSFERTTSVPGIVAEKPGQTQIQISSPVGGILSEIDVVQGEAIEPGSKMFDVQLTHEELVVAQQELLKTAESADVVEREITRLQSLSEGVIAGKRLLEQQYEKQKLNASLEAAKQALLVHGLTEPQVTEILQSRKLLRSISIYAPKHAHADNGSQAQHTFHIQRLAVSRGQQVETSQELAVLADHCELYVEGRAFEDDAPRLRDAARQGWEVSAQLVAEQGGAGITGLKLLYLSDTVDPESRAFHFYLKLPNMIAFEQKDSDDHRFVDWKFKPGQRLDLKVPVEQWAERIVVPVEAVVDEGAESYVYRQNGSSFDRVAVKVDYRDGESAVIANDGVLFPGDIIAGAGAYQMHLAMKNKAGGGIDPHAGHNH